MKITSTFLILLTLLSCEDVKDEELSNDFYVTVVGSGRDCNLTLIDFQVEDSSRINDISGYSGWLRYHALDLDSTFNEVGSTLNITIRSPKDDELFPCTALGPSYPWVIVLTAEKVN